MANELLDFVMSLVRDPAVAARYAADPAGTIADAHLDGVTSADVNNLIPMVSDSLSMAAPAFGAGEPSDANVWTSGAATAALDAFTPHDAGLGWTGGPGEHDGGGVIDTAESFASGGADLSAISPDDAAALPPDEASVQFSGAELDQPTGSGVDPAIGDPAGLEAHDGLAVDHGLVGQHDPEGLSPHAGFDIFD